MARSCTRTPRTATSTTSRSRGRSSRRPPTSTPPRTSCWATPAAMSCHPSSSRRASCASGCAEAKRRLDAKRAAEQNPVPRSRPQRLREAEQRHEQEFELELELVPPDTRTPVSYTHLRAHETDSYLVCRL